MVGVFRRSLSFPNKLNPSRPSKPAISHHVRSVSLPCSRSHPLISQLNDNLGELDTWNNDSQLAHTSAWLCDGLSRLKTIHDNLDDVLQQPQSSSQASLLGRRFPNFVEKLLEDFLSFADVYGRFQTLLSTLKQAQLTAQFGLKRRDPSKVCSYLKSSEKLAKEINKLLLIIRRIEKSFMLAKNIVVEDDDEIMAAIKKVHEVTIMVSTALLNGMSTSLLRSRKLSWAGVKLSKRGKEEEGIEEFRQVGIEGLNKMGDDETRVVLKRMQELEGCIGNIENGSDGVFRGLINTRVSLLNVLTL